VYLHYGRRQAGIHASSVRKTSGLLTLGSRSIWTSAFIPADKFSPQVLGWSFSSVRRGGGRDRRCQGTRSERAGLRSWEVRSNERPWTLFGLRVTWLECCGEVESWPVGRAEVNAVDVGDRLNGQGSLPRLFQSDLLKRSSMCAAGKLRAVLCPPPPSTPDAH
jgi:hypothetical protein